MVPISKKDTSECVNGHRLILHLVPPSSYPQALIQLMRESLRSPSRRVRLSVRAALPTSDDLLTPNRLVGSIARLPDKTEIHGPSR